MRNKVEFHDKKGKKSNVLLIVSLCFFRSYDHSLIHFSSCITQEARITFEATMLLKFTKVTCHAYLFNKIELFTIYIAFLSTKLG